MIRINLLPRDEQAKVGKSSGPNFAAFAPFLILPLVLLAVGVSAALERTKLKTLQNDVSEVRTEVRALQPQVDRVNRLTAKREELERRLEVIHKLDEDRFLAVRVMDNLSRQIPRYLWLSDVNQASPDRISISGMTFSNLIVADLMMRMERSPMFSDIDLQLAERGTADGREVVKFAISGLVNFEETATDFTADALTGRDE